jgi:hypothetical protein
VPVTYEVVTTNRAGQQRTREFASETELARGDTFRLHGRDWLVDAIEDATPPRVIAKPARYRLRLRHPEGREELGVFRRLRPDAPRLGHVFTTTEDGRPINWQVVDERFTHDERGEPYLDLTADRDYSEGEELSNHELEHALARGAEELPDAASATFTRAEQAGLDVELVALEPNEAPDWAEAERFIDTLIYDEIGDDLFELCGVTDPDSHEAALRTVQDRLRSDLEAFRDDIEGDGDEIEEWDFRDGSIFATVGSFDDEADPNNGHGWLVRLVDSDVLGAAGFSRVRKAELQP